MTIRIRLPPRRLVAPLSLHRAWHAQASRAKRHLPPSRYAALATHTAFARCWQTCIPAQPHTNLVPSLGARPSCSLSCRRKPGLRRAPLPYATVGGPRGCQRFYTQPVRSTCTRRQQCTLAPAHTTPAARRRLAFHPTPRVSIKRCGAHWPCARPSLHCDCILADLCPIHSAGAPCAAAHTTLCCLLLANPTHIERCTCLLPTATSCWAAGAALLPVLIAVPSDARCARCCV